MALKLKVVALSLCLLVFGAMDAAQAAVPGRPNIDYGPNISSNNVNDFVCQVERDCTWGWLPVPGATKYTICITGTGYNGCDPGLYRRDYSPALRNGHIYYGLNLPAGYAGYQVGITVKACNAEGCGLPQSAQAILMPRGPALLSPSNNSVESGTSRRVTFRWAEDSGSTSEGYLLIYGRDINSISLPTDTFRAPNTISFLTRRVSLNAGVTSTRVEIPENLGDKIQWTVLSCARVPQGKFPAGKYCRGYAKRHFTFPPRIARP